jgi:hypothetical protein
LKRVSKTGKQWDCHWMLAIEQNKNQLLFDHSNTEGKLYMKNIKTGLLALIAIAVTVGALWFTNRSVTPKEATWEDVEAEAIMGDYKLISIDDLWERYRKNPDSMLVVDTRQAWEYQTGHIKGAVNFPMEPTWFSRWQKKGDLETFLGSDKDRFIVFY